MLQFKRVSMLFIGGALLIGLLLFLTVAAPTAAAPDTVTGLVFLDTNESGLWGPGEPGFGGVTITIETPAYDEFVLESASAREADYEGETDLCSYQDTMVDGEINPSPIRPCEGTWGLPGTSENVRFIVTVTAPEGYYVTSENPQIFVSGTDQAPLDFGIAPLAE